MRILVFLRRCASRLISCHSASTVCTVCTACPGSGIAGGLVGRIRGGSLVGRTGDDVDLVGRIRGSGLVGSTSGDGSLIRCGHTAGSSTGADPIARSPAGCDFAANPSSPRTSSTSSTSSLPNRLTAVETSIANGSSRQVAPWRCRGSRRRSRGSTRGGINTLCGSTSWRMSDGLRIHADVADLRFLGSWVVDNDFGVAVVLMATGSDACNFH